MAKANESRPPVATDYGKPRTDAAQGAADLASILGSYSAGEQANRVARGNQSQTYDQLMLQAQGNQRNNETDALRKLAVTDYLKSGGSDYQAPSIQFQGGQRSLPTFGFGPKAISAEVQQGAGDLEDTLLKRMQPGGSYMPTELESYSQPGLGERIGNYASLGMGALGALDTTFGGQGIGGLLSRIPGLGGGSGGALNALGLTGAQNAAGINSLAGQGLGGAVGGGSGIMGLLGKTAPIAGIATGAMGLMKDRGWAGNMANGATTGAGVGSMIMPGVGTAIGAGVGALGGLLRGVGGGPSPEELAGRSAASEGRMAITQGATPQQLAEAQSAGWENPQDALTMIVLRDRLGEQNASMIMNRLHSAEKQGPQAVNSILSLLG